MESFITETELSVLALSKKSKKPDGVTPKLTETRAVSSRISVTLSK